jgi:threonyl-tRNA synthetase
VTAALRSARVRAEIDARNETLGNRVRMAQQQKPPLMLVLGAQEEAEDTVSLRRRGERAVMSMPLDKFVERIGTAVRSRADF